VNLIHSEVKGRDWDTCPTMTLTQHKPLPSFITMRQRADAFVAMQVPFEAIAAAQ
jgi:hypothetical protein